MSDESNKSSLLSTSNNRLFSGVLITSIAYLYSIGYDEPGSLQITIQKTFEIEAYEFELLYTVYSIPNIFLCFLNGIIIDKLLGLELGGFIFGLVAIVGQIIATIGSFMLNYWVLLLGRFIYGLGAESSAVSINCYIILWFFGREINFMNAVFAGFLKLGTSTVFLFNTPLFNSFKTYKLGYTSLVFTLIAVLVTILVKILGRYTSKYKTHKSSTIKLSYIVKYPISFWINITIISLQTGCVISFVSVSQEVFQNRYNLTLDEANDLSSFYNLIAGLIPVIPGLAADIIGFDLYIVLVGGILGVLSYLLFLFTNLTPYVPLVLFATGYAIINTINWSIIAYLVEPYQLATAIGVAFSFCDLANTVFPVLTGYLIDKYGTDSIFGLFLVCFSVCFVLIVIMIILDIRNGRVLVMRAKDRRQLLDKQSTYYTK